MKQKMTLQDVWDYYKTSSIIQTHEGFEFPDEARGFTLVIASHEFYRYFDGGLIDPAMMLVDRTGWMRRELFKSLELCTPVLLRYAFGKATRMVGEELKFYMLDPMKPTTDSIDIWVEAEWDLRQGVSNEGWISEVERNWSGGLVLFKKTLPEDTYETRGKQVWILRAAPVMMEIMKLKTDFYTWQRQMIERSDEILKKFETEKEGYQEKIIECLSRLPGRIRWIVVDVENEWPRENTNLELWGRNEYDWQIVQYDEHLEIRWRGGSPGVIMVERPRYDAMGLQICRDLVVAQK